MASFQTNTVVSSVSSTSAAPSAAPTACGATTYDIPTQDAACAVLGTAKKDSMEKCCKSPVVSYDKGCGMYCLASGQSVGDLVNCLIGGGFKDGDVFCNKQLNVTASASPTSTSSRDDNRGKNKPSATQTRGAATSSGAADTFIPHQPMSKPAIGVLFTLFFSAFAGMIFV
ncbi:hypothetical protein LOZ66_000426 [Ophidiomyces ophidiicola]|nr:hypothetical protein LOZ66_000426 [Ophidiomyces ophidiicola]